MLYKKCLYMVLIGFVLLFNDIHAEGQSTTSKSGSSKSRDFSGESMFTGDVSFSIPLGSLDGVNISVSYNSNIHKQVRSDNRISPTNWIGLGWNLNLGSIVADIGNTRDYTDDRYYYVNDGGTTELINIGADDFILKQYQYWKIKRIRSLYNDIVGWEIIKDDGTINRFGNYNKNSSPYYFSDGSSNATQYLISFGGFVSNPPANSYSNGWRVPIQWDISDVTDILGNHTTIDYQQEQQQLNYGSSYTTLFYTKESHPLKISNPQGESIEFSLSEKYSFEYYNANVSFEQSRYEKKYLKYIYFKRNNVLREYVVFNHDTSDNVGNGIRKRYLKEIGFGVSLSELPNTPTKYDYYGLHQSVGAANPGALKEICTNTGKKINYVYKNQAVNQNLNSSISFSNSTFNLPAYQKTGIVGKDFYVVKQNDNTLKVYTFNKNDFTLDQTFSGLGAVVDFRVVNDYLLIQTTIDQILLFRRTSNAWEGYDWQEFNIVDSLPSGSNPGPGLSIAGAGVNAFAISYNYTQNGSSGPYRNTDIAVFRPTENALNAQYIGNYDMDGYYPIPVNVAFGSDYFVLKFCENSGSDWWINEHWIYELGHWVHKYDDPSTQIGIGGLFHLISNNFVVSVEVKPGQTNYIRIYQYVNGNYGLSREFSTGSQITDAIVGDRFFALRDGNTLKVYTWDGNSWSETDGSALFSYNALYSMAVMDGNKLLVGARTDESANQRSDMSIRQVELSNSGWVNHSIVAREYYPYYYGSPDIGYGIGLEIIPSGNTLFAEWYQDAGNILYKNKAIKKNGNFWIVNELSANFAPGSTFFQPGLNYSAFLSIGATVKTYLEGASSIGLPSYLNQPYDFPVETKITTDGMGNSSTTTFIFENGVYDETFNFVKYNKSTIVPPGNIGKTITYYYNDLGPGVAEDFIGVSNYTDLDGMPYKIKVFKEDENTTPISSAIYYWTSLAISGGAHYSRIDSVFSTVDGLTKVTLTDYNNPYSNQIVRVTNKVSALSNLSGERDLVTEISYASQQSQYTNMLSANMLTQVYEKKVSAVNNQITTISAGVNNDAGGPMTSTNSFTVGFSQTVTYLGYCSSSICRIKIGTTPGGSNILNSQNGYVSGTFQFTAGTTYYLEASVTPTMQYPFGNANISINYIAGVDLPNVLLSWERTEYDATKLPLVSKIWDGTQWLTTNTILSRDSYGNILESQNAASVKSSTFYGFNSQLPIASVLNADRSKVTLDDFEDGDLVGWTTTDNSTTGNTTWINSNKKLKISYPSGSIPGGEFDRISLDLPAELTGTTIFEFDLRIADSDSWDFIIGLGGDLWGGQEWVGSEMAVWSAINNESWYYATGSWNIVKTGMNIGSKYHIKIVVNPITGKVDYYLDGLKMIAGGNVRQSTTGIKKIVFGRYGYSTLLSTWYVDNIRVYPEGGMITTNNYNPTTFQTVSSTDVNGVSTFYEYDKYGRQTGVKNDDKRILTANSYYSSADANSGVFTSTDPNVSTSVSYTSSNGHSDFTTSSGWTVSGDLTFNTPLGEELSTVRMGTATGSYDYMYKPAGAGNIIARVDFYPDVTTDALPHVIAFDDGSWRLCVLYNATGTVWSGAQPNTFVVQDARNGWSSYSYTPLTGLSAPRNSWYTVEIEKNSDGRMYAFVYPKGEGRNYKSGNYYETTGFPSNWNSNVQSWSSDDYYYLANHYVGEFSQSTTYQDGAGNNIQTQIRDGVNDIITISELDQAGRPYRNWRSYSFNTNHKYDGNATNGTRILSVFGISNPYSETMYFADRLSRIQTNKIIGTTTTDENTNYSYGGPETVNGQLTNYQETKIKKASNQPWIVSRTYKDKMGRVLKTATNAEGAGEEIVNTTSYTMLGKPYQTTDPKGYITTFKYDFLGNLIQKNNPDEGTSKYFYDSYGKLRFMVDTVGILSGNDKILYWKYDVLGNVKETGYFFDRDWSTLSSTNANDTTFPSASISLGYWRKRYVYNIIGQLETVFTNNDNDVSSEVEEYISYDKYGNTTTKSIKIIDYNASTLYSTAYRYDLLGRLTRTDYPVSSYDSVGVTYEYDQVGRTTRVGLAGSTASYATYTYNNKGELQTETMNPTGGSGSQLRTFSYSSKGMLSAINNSNFTETLNPVGAGSVTNYHGIMGSIGTTYGSFTPTPPSPYTQNIVYDKYGQMIQVTGGAFALQNVGAATPTDYDLNGNIKWLEKGGTYRQYNYVNGKNIPQTIGSWNYSADLTGNITSAGSSGASFTYDIFTQMPIQTVKTPNTLNFQYDGRKERVYKEVINGSPTKTVYLHGNSDFPIMHKESNGNERVYAYGPTGLLAVRMNSAWYFVHKDHLGTTRAVTNAGGTVVARYDLDPYGDIVGSFENTSVKYTYTGHEYETEGGYFNFRARFYDTKVGLFYAADPAHQTNSPYGYAGNNPTLNVDKDGRLFGLSLTKLGYELDKLIFPVAVKLSFEFGSNKRGIGFDVSYGLPKLSPLSYRRHYGESYSGKNYGNLQGKEIRKGGEWSAFSGSLSLSGTTYYNKYGTQTTNSFTVGGPYLNVQYENDFFWDLHLPGVPPADNGDRYRSAAAKINVGYFGIGMQLFTGDPGPNGYRENLVDQGGNYVKSPGYDPDQYRDGVLFFDFGFFRFGLNSEWIRDKIQNGIVHKRFSHSPYFKVLNIPNRSYYYFGTGLGDTLW